MFKEDLVLHTTHKVQKGLNKAKDSETKSELNQGVWETNLRMAKPERSY